MKRTKYTAPSYLLLMALTLLLLTGCASSKKVVYFQDLDSTQLKSIKVIEDSPIQSGDLLAIMVSGPDKAVTAPYNLTMSESAVGDPAAISLGYLVDTEGKIKFPLLGTLSVTGMTCSELESYLTREIGKDVKDVIVSVQIRNFKITVLGDVAKPGTYNIDGAKVSVLQALGLAGDLLISGRRENVLLIRKEGSKQICTKIDLRKKEVLESPNYYLRQNDVLYVSPRSSSVFQRTTNTSFWGIIISSVTAVLALLSILK